MGNGRDGRGLGGVVIATLCLGVSGYFVFAAVQGDYGLLRRLEIEADLRAMEVHHAALSAEVARMENLTRRLSDDFLDLDLLDERARDMLGLVRPDEIVIR